MDPFDLLVGVARGDLPVVEPRIAARFEPREGADGFAGLLEEQALVEAAPTAGSPPQTHTLSSPSPDRDEAGRQPPPFSERPPAPVRAEESRPAPAAVEGRRLPRESEAEAPHGLREAQGAVNEPASSILADRRDTQPPSADRARLPVAAAAPAPPAILARTVVAEPAQRAAEADRPTPRGTTPEQRPAVTIRIEHLQITAPPEPRRAEPARPLPSRQPAETLEAYLARRRQGRW